jgi:poly(3-hydroxybutyrate) depolymerase
MPLVFVLHGGGGNMQQAVKYTPFHTLAATEGFIVCYPSAVKKN